MVGHTERPEDFGRYDPITHTLFIDRPSRTPGEGKPLGIHVGAEGRLRAVLGSGVAPPQRTWHKGYIPRLEGETGKHHVPRHEDLGRYDPIASRLTFQTDNGETSIRVGAGGRLHAALASGKIQQKDAAKMGITPEEFSRSKAQISSNEGRNFNPLTGEGTRSVGHKDWHQSCRRPIPKDLVNPVYNPLTFTPDLWLSSAQALQSPSLSKIQPLRTKLYG